MTSFKYDQFVAFGADSAGLERILRGLQALTSILSSNPILLTLFLSQDTPLLDALAPLRGHLGLTRRFIRFFWFLNSFGLSYNTYASLPSSARNAGVEVWLDVLRFTLLGLYGGLESATLPDLLGIPQLQLFGEAQTKALNIEAQRFWFLALACAIVGNLVRMLKAFAYAPVPQHGEGYGTGEAGKKAGEQKVAERAVGGGGGGGGGDGDAAPAAGVGDEKKVDNADEKLDWEAERARLRAIVVKRREQRKRWRQHVSGTVKTLGRKVCSDTLDCLIPGVILGWFDIGPGAVGVAMFTTTILTSRDIWERCGADVRAKRGGS